MKIRTDFVTNSSCACFMAWECDYEELARALLKFVIKEDKYEYVEYGYEYFRINSYGFEAHYKNPSLDGCAYLDGDTIEYLDEDENEIDCPEDHECGVYLRGALEDFGYDDEKEYIFDDGKQHNSYVETKDGKLYAREDINYVNVSLSYHQDVFDNLDYYSREQLGENSGKGVERLEFNYPSLAKAILLDIQQKDIEEWKEKFEKFEISINNEDEFKGKFDDHYLHVHSNGDIEVSVKLCFCSPCWDEESCNDCGMHYCWQYGYYYYDDSLERITLRQLFEEALYIYPKNVDTILEDGTVVTHEVYKDINGNIFELNSPEVKPIGHVEHEYDKRFYILYDKDNEIVDLFYEEDLQKFVEEKSLTIDDKKENIYEQGKLVYTVKCTSINELLDNQPDIVASLECGSTD